MPFCSTCGHGFQERDIYCAGCGRTLATHAPVPRRPVNWVWVSTLLLAGFVCVIAMIAPAVKQEADRMVDEKVHAARSAVIRTEPEIKHEDPPEPPDAKAIRAVMLQLVGTIDTLRAQSEQQDKGAQLSDSYLRQKAQIFNDMAAKAKSVSLSACPRDFAEAYVRWVSSISEMGEVLEMHPHIRTEDEKVVEGFLHGLNGDLTGGVLEMQGEIKEWVNTVSAAYRKFSAASDEVKAIGVRHGVE